ncbi:MAG: hypothetical protein WBD02_08870 [Acidimicrobiia bacterium]
MTHTEMPEEEQVAPAVVALVFLDEACASPEGLLRSIAAQDYPSLTAFVQHTGAIDASLIAEILPAAIRREVPEGATPSEVFNDAIASVDGAPFLCTVHGSITLDAAVVRTLVEEAFRSNAAVVGPKFTAADGSGRLIDVGWYTDRTGHPYSGIEIDELDQEQRDGVRDVFFVAQALMLMRSDLIDEIGTFDIRCEPGAAELDFCWRARIAGGRVLVAPDARVSVAGETVLRHSVHFPVARTRALVRNASAWSLCWAIPAGVVLGCIEALALLIARKPKRAAVALQAWMQLAVSPGIWRSRHEVQRHRVIRDTELRFVQIRGSARIREFLERYHADDRISAAGDATRAMATSMLDLLRQPLAYGWLMFVGLVGFGSRRFFGSGLPAVGEMLPWPGVRPLAGAFAQPWRYTGFGSARPASPALALMSAWTFLTGGDGGRAAVWFVLALWVIGALGAYRLTRPYDRMPLAALAAGLAYGINPAVVAMISHGRLQSLVFYAGAPWMLAACISAGRAARGRARIRSTAAMAALIAIVGCFQPLAFLFLPVVVLVWFASVALGGGPKFVVRSIVQTGIASIAAIALVFPWPLAYARRPLDLTALGLTARPDVSVGDVFAFGHSTPLAGWAMLFAAVLPLLIARSNRLVWAVRAWMILLAGSALGWIGPRLGEMPWPSIDVTSIVMAVACAFAIGLGIGAITDELTTATFGWRQILSGTTVASLAIPGAFFVMGSLEGGWNAPEKSWSDVTANFAYDTKPGDFRVLWISPAEAAVGAPILSLDGAVIGISRNGVGDSRDLLPAASAVSERILGDALNEAQRGLTNRVGELLGPMGIRYIAVIDRAGPDESAVPFTNSWQRSFDSQLDLVARRVDTGMQLYENTRWVPIRSTFRGSDAERVRDGADARDPLGAAVRVADAKPLAFPGTKVGTGDVAVLAESNAPGWKGPGSKRFAAYGWGNGFEGPVSSITYSGDSKWVVLRAFCGLAWVLLVAVFIATRRREESE